MKIIKGERGKLAQIGVDDHKELTLRMRISGPAAYDFACFGLDKDGLLSNEAYMIFYNQPSSPENAIRWTNETGGALFNFNLSRLPPVIDKLAFDASIDGQGTMSQASACVVELIQDGKVLINCEMTGADFKDERAIIGFEIYRKPDWRYSATMSGFNGGLGDLLRHYGGEEDQSQAKPKEKAAPQADPDVRVSLEKKLAKAPELVNLAKPLAVQLKKRNLQNVVARVALVMDISGSMYDSYRNGVVQEIINKTLPLAVQFDDDGNLDLWYYGTTFKKMPDVNLSNYKSAVPRNWDGLMSSLGYGNNEPAVMGNVIKYFDDTSLPVYVLFVTDGGVSAESQISSLLKKASKKPIFWQFVGVSGSNYGVLERLDTMTGRYVDNAGFFALDDFRRVSNDELYDRLLNEFPEWLKEIRAKGMIRG